MRYDITIGPECAGSAAPPANLHIFPTSTVGLVPDSKLSFMNCITLAEAAYRPSQQVEEKVIIIAPHSLCIAIMYSPGSELSKEQNRNYCSVILILLNSCGSINTY